MGFYGIFMHVHDVFWPYYQLLFSLAPPNISDPFSTFMAF